MSVIVRLARGGTKKKPFYHVVVADKERCRDGKYLARLGTYNPKAAVGSRFLVKVEDVQAWVEKGAKLSETVGHLVKAAAKSK